VRAVDGDNVFELGTFALALFDKADEFGTDEHNLAAGVVENVGDLGRGETPVDAHERDVALAVPSSTSK